MMIEESKKTERMNDEIIARNVYLWNEWKHMEEEMHEDDREEWIARGVGDEYGWEEPI